MSQQTSPAPRSRAQLRQRWLERAAAAFDRMFDDARQDQLVTFDQREACACTGGEELAAWLLEQHVAADPCVRPAADQAPVCPKCGRPGQRVTPADQTLPQRQLTTWTGNVTLAREQWRCTTCRVVFFPLGPETATGHGGLQSAGAAQSGASGVQGAVVSGSQRRSARAGGNRH